MSPATVEAIRTGEVAKGDVVGVSRTAGILAAKSTPSLLPLCHPLLVTHIDVDVKVGGKRDYVEVVATVKGVGKTGFEMEALTAASVAALNVYDMCKAVDRGMVIGDTRLVGKEGGKSDARDEGKGSEECGRLAAICMSETREGTKSPVPEAVLKADYGLVGDAHAGTRRQVSLLGVEIIRKLRGALEMIEPDRMERMGVRVEPGDSAENLVTEGIELTSLPVGTHLHVGDEAVLEVTEQGKEFHRPGFYLLPLAGLFARVVRGGEVKVGDPVRIGRVPP
jgi:cyclic pyranopterin phosphate synthase